MGIDLKTFRHNERGLWNLVGEFLCSREVSKELGGQIFSAEGTTWFVAVEGKKTVGFCTLSMKAGKHWIDGSYVVPDKRHKGIHKRLAAERMKYIQGLESGPIAVCCRESRWKHYESQGFVVTQVRGSWIYGEKHVEN